jgi:translation initiation factor 4E
MSAARQVTDTDTLLNQTHYLNSNWTMWFDNPKYQDPNKEWKDNLTKCGSFDTIEDFWRIFNNLKPASQLSTNSNYHVFREGVIPMWEDPHNKVRHDLQKIWLRRG